ncbi:PP2C family protein-serine/threonine phosphatase [Arcobacter sp. FWKO B]|uniref:PP2C family protein-serine/threonine phosphatase n=1 Tax=Arcobacter sp. FWKO B TaxID=2593672 RepID=UPI0018A4D1DC|nr:PP2C family serine/threonine-protein phosphatase [Arcobacter sp. FWKO B]QOG13205.1 serine/threonine-protein phosphatase [Arcobacter sp. FWKO B]
MNFESYCITHPGKIRKNNEDSYFVNDEFGLWIVCDGMGGHQEGNFASRAVSDMFEHMKFSLHYEKNIESIISQIYNIHLLLKNKAQKTGKNSVIGTTIVLLYIQNNRGTIIHAGDSRCYVLRNNILELLTDDHAKEIDTSNGKRKVLTNALSAPGELSLEIQKIDIMENDIYLLCTDGMYETLNDTFIKETIENVSIESALDTMSQKVLCGLASDNLTAVIVRITNDK